MKRSRITLILLVILAAFLLTSCGAALSGTSWPGVSSNGDTLYVAYMNSVYGVRISDGSMIWRYPTENSRVTYFAAPLLVENQLIVGDYGNTLHSLDPNTGAEKWSFAGAKGDWIASPLAVDGMILAPNADHSLYALSLNGSLLWKFETGRALWSRPVSDGTRVYQASMDHSLYAINLENGTEVWSVDVSGAVIYSPTLSDEGVLYLTTLARNLLAIDAQSGRILWQRTFEENLWAQPALHEGRLYFGDLTGKIYAVSAENGNDIWTQNVGEPVTGKPAVTDSSVIFTTEAGSMIATSLSGERLWSKTFDGKLYTGPVVVGDRLAVGITGGNSFLTLVSSNGQDVWTFVPPK